MPDFKRIMGEALEIDETEFNAVIDSEENPAVAEATAASRKAHLQSLNNLAISRRRFMILSMVALETMEMKRRRKEEEAAEKEKLRLEEAAEKEKRGGARKIKCANSCVCSAWKRTEDNSWVQCSKCTKMFCSSCVKVVSAHEGICKRGRSKQQKTTDGDDD